MEQLKSLTISSRVFARLQALAVPLVDDVGSVIEKLIDHWETKPKFQSTSPQEPPPKTWRTRDGDVLVVGEKLKAKYLGHRVEAQIELNFIVFEDRSYPSLSAAARAVKKKCGKTGRTLVTNGRQFWNAKDSTGQFVKVIERR